MRNFDPKRKLLVLAKKFWAPSKVCVVQSCHKHSSSPKICGWPWFLRHDSNSNVYVEWWMIIMVIVLFLRLMVVGSEGRSSDLRRGCVTPGAVGLDDMRRSCGLSLWDVDSLLRFYELEAILRMTWGLGWGLLKGAGYFHSAGQSKEGNLVLALPSIRFSWNFYQIISGTKYE